jgi:hypothetical protein
MTWSVRMLQSAFSDRRWEIHQAIAEGDTEVLHCAFRGRHTDALAQLLSDLHPERAARAGSPPSRGLRSAHGERSRAPPVRPEADRAAAVLIAGRTAG